MTSLLETLRRTVAVARLHSHERARRAPRVSNCWPRALGALLLCVAFVCLGAAATVAAPGDAPDTPARLVYLRADAANGSGPYARPGKASPWVDLTGHGHDAALVNIGGSPTSGWMGEGTLAAAYRLEFDGEENRVVIPGGSIPELQDSTRAVTAEVWFKTGFQGASTRYDYLLEWLQRGDRGMSIAVESGQLQVYLAPWVSVGAVAPDHWYHVAVVKQPGDVRIYVNGEQRYAGSNDFMGRQDTPVGIGVSTFRYIDGTGSYGDYLRGAIGQVAIWSGALSDSAVRASYLADSGLYQPRPPDPPVALAVSLRADSADGARHYAIPGAAGPWVDLAGAATSATLRNFAGADTTSGWAGFGRPASPYRLAFDGVNDVVTVAAGSVAELQRAGATTTEWWLQTGPNVGAGMYRYLAEWLSGPGSSTGMSVAVAEGKLKVYLRGPHWVDVAVVGSGTWYHVAVVKDTGSVQVYVNGTLTHTGAYPHIGTQGTELVLGASVWRGAGVYGDYFDGALGAFRVWRGALSGAVVQAQYRADSAAYFGETLPFTITATAGAHGTIDPSVPVSVPAGANQTFTMTPEAGYHVASVVVDGVPAGAPTSYEFTNVTADHAIGVEFEMNVYTITATADFGGSIDPSGAVLVTHGDGQSFTITVNPNATLANVLVDGVPVGAVTSYEFTNVTASHTIAARFDVETHAITATAGPGGSINPSGAVAVKHGDDQSFTITPEAHHHVADVLVDGESAGPITSLSFSNVVTEHTIAASFAGNSYTLDVAIAGTGSVTRSPDQPSHAPGDIVTLTAIPGSGFAFQGWSGDISGTDNPVELAMNANRGVTATFADTVLPVVQLLAPNGGEAWFVGSSQAVTWSASDNAGITAVDIDYTMDDGATWQLVAAGLVNAGSYSWTVPAPPAAAARVRVTARDAFDNIARDTCDADLSISVPPAVRLVEFRADSASGTGPYPSPGARSPWVGLAGERIDAHLRNFLNNEQSGWNGDGSVASPYRLEFSGFEERATVPAASVPGLQNPVRGVTTELWFRAPSDPQPNRFYYLFEWLESGDAGMSLAVQNGRLLVYLRPWTDVGAVVPASWHHVAVAKSANQVRVFVDGRLIHSGSQPLLGAQHTEIVIGASTWRGPGLYGDFYSGAIAQVAVWQGAVTDSQARVSYFADAARYRAGTLGVDARVHGLELAGLTPNPATRSLNVSFTLPDAAPATLELLDVSGRRVRAREVGSLGPGAHRADLSQGTMPAAGMYWIRLSQGGRTLVRKAAVVR